jgi:hypothetical protein
MFLIRFSLIATLFLLSSCNNNCVDLEIDLPKKNIAIKVDHLEEDLFSQATNSLSKHELLLKKYGTLYVLFYAQMLNEGDPYKDNAPTILNNYINHSSTQEIKKETKTQFKDFNPYKESIEKAFKYVNHYYPDSSIPIITTFYSNFNANVIEVNNRIAIGLEMYLGEENKVVKSLSPDFFPLFIKKKMNHEFLVTDVMHCYFHNRFYENLGDDFISEIISLGKIMYYIEATTPSVDEHLKFRYSKEELEWCNSNEMNIWEVIINSNLLYSKDKKQITPFISEAPFTKGLPQESPSKVGVWLGYKIVKDYVEANCIDVLDLQLEKDVRKILKSYKPNE